MATRSPAAVSAVNVLGVASKISEIPKVTALVAGLDGHRTAHPYARPGNLALRQDAEQDHQLLLPSDLRVDDPTRLRHPQRTRKCSNSGAIAAN